MQKIHNQSKYLRNMKKSIVAILSATALMACQKTENPMPESNTVRISPVLTRVTDVNFEDGDQIGLTIMRGDETYAENSQLTFSGGEFSGSLTWYAEAAETSTLTAYYPYDASGAPATFTVASDQTTGYEDSDLIAGTKSGVTPSASAVVINFKHLLTKIVLNLTNDSGSEITAVKLSGSKRTADVDLNAMTATANASSSAEDITAQEVSAGSQYRVIVVPQTVAFTLSVTTASGTVLEQKLASTELKAGGQYTMTARVTPEGLDVLISGEIDNWTDEGEIGPDTPAEEVSFEEFDGYFVYDGEEYKTVTLSDGSVWMAEPMRYVPEGYTPSGDPAADSHIWYPYSLSGGGDSINATEATALTDDESIRKYGLFYDMYVALGGTDVTVDNCYDFEGAQGICPPGWHIPTRTEFFNLCGLSNKNALGESGNQINTEALFYDADYGGGKRTLYEEAGWNYVLSGVRMMTNFNSTPRYQLTQLYSGNTSLPEDYYGMPGLTYHMSSTCYKPIYSTANPEELTNIQFFAQMTTFTKIYPEGRINVAYISTLSGQQLRCVKDAR